MEHLDGDGLEERVLAGNLRDLERLNRWLGGVAISRKAVAALARRRGDQRDGSGLRLLDVGTGSGDIPAALVSGSDRACLEVVATDIRPAVLAIARQARSAHARIAFELADGTRLPYPEGSFDIAHASLTLHHLEPAAAVGMLGELARVARIGLVINDLDRTRRGWLGAWLLLHLMTGNRYTRHDGPLSVQRSYRPSEVVSMASHVGLIEVARYLAPFGHRYAIAFAAPVEPV
jgi:ubiquinone/menaquinone biosynthesis C-methylase UbiE